MTRITALSMSRNILADLNAANARLTKTQEQLASGKLLNRPSDDPSGVARAIQLRTDIEATQQHQKNASEATGWSDVTDSALASIADALMRARELTVQGANGAAGPESHQAIAQELTGLIDTVKTAGNASYGGRFVFAGTATNVRPYAMGADDTYGGDTERVTREIGPGVTVPVNAHGREVIGDDDEGLLNTLRTILTAAENEDPAAMSAQLDELDVRLDELNAVRAKIGATANRVAVAHSRLAEYEGTALGLLNETESIDIAKTMIEYSVHEAAYQAGLRAGANIVQASLLDFLR
jgi:flagellar hook-associated protein 3 FlgL